MQIATVLLLLVLVVTGLFAALNWPAFTAPMTLFVGVTDVQLPLGLLMLGVLAVVSLLFVASALALQARALAELRRHARELQAQRQLADQAEASRFTELRDFMAAELDRVFRNSDAVRDTLLARLDRMESQHRLLIEQTGNTLSSYIGELEDRFERGTGRDH
jgi:biopolymer transport protein ExbB/TolQ